MASPHTEIVEITAAAVEVDHLLCVSLIPARWQRVAAVGGDFSHARHLQLDDGEILKLVPSMPVIVRRRAAPAITDAQLDAVYAERNACAVALAAAGSLLGWKVGVGSDPDEPGWPVLFDDPYHHLSVSVMLMPGGDMFRS